MLVADDIINRLRTKKWWVEEAPGVPFLFDYIMKIFVYAEKVIGFLTLKEHITIKKNIVLEISPYNEKIENFNYILQRELKKPGYFLKILKPWHKLRKG